MHNFKNPKMEILHVFHEGSLKKYMMSFYQKKVELHYSEKLLLNFACGQTISEDLRKFKKNGQDLMIAHMYRKEPEGKVGMKRQKSNKVK